MPDAMLLAFDDEAALAGALAAELGWPLRFVEQHRFPDGEIKLTLPAGLPPRLVLLRGLHQPNDKLVALLLAARTARSLGAQHLTLVAPYLAYMRQDMAFQPGEAVSQRIVTGFLADIFDALVTIDPHLHRVATLDELIPGRRGVALSAAPLIGQWLAQRQHLIGEQPLLVGPDEEAGQWVHAAAATSGWHGAVCCKVRRGDRDVAIELPRVELRGRAVVLIDDVASTGQTLIQAARALLGAGVASVDAVVTHALFIGEAIADMHAAGIRQVWSTDAVPHACNAVPVAALLAGALRDVLAAPGRP